MNTEKDRVFADEALAGLSSTEDLAAASTALRRTAKDSSGISTEIKDFGGFLPVMLIQIKGWHLVNAFASRFKLGQCKNFLTFDAMDRLIKCDHSLECCRAVLCCDVVCLFVF